MIELRPITFSSDIYEAMETQIKALFEREIYRPLLREFQARSKVLRNAREDLLWALQSGRLSFSRGRFGGTLNATLTKELRALGAMWDKRTRTYRLLLADLPMDVRAAISASEARFEEKLEKIDRKLAAVVPEQLAQQLKIRHLFDRSLWQVDRQFRKNVEKIKIQPVLSEVHKERIASEWQTNMDLSIQKFTEAHILELRQQIRANFLAGHRYEGMIQTIQESYGVTARKAKFLARQETMLLTSKFAEVRYQENGIYQYKWRCVAGTADHPTRLRHKHLAALSDKGQLFRFEDPPNTTETSNPDRPTHEGPANGFNNPGEDFNCLPGGSQVGSDQTIRKIYRRFFTGKLTLLVAENGTTLESTGNHPILTSRGWMSAQTVQLGDYVFERKPKGFEIEIVNGQKMISSLQDIFQALSIFIPIATQFLSRSDFHGDVSEEKQVHIISVNRELILAGISKLSEVIGEFLLQGSDSSSSLLCSIEACLQAWGLTPQTLIGFAGELLLFLKSHSPHSEAIGFGTRPFGNALLSEPSRNDAALNSVFMRNGELTHPCLIILDRLLMDRDLIPGGESAGSLDFDSTPAESLAEQVRIYSELPTNIQETSLSGFIKPLRIIDKTFRDFSDHIYNLETRSHWYTANDLIVHNCRCHASPVLDFRKTLWHQRQTSP